VRKDWLTSFDNSPSLIGPIVSQEREAALGV